MTGGDGHQSAEAGGAGATGPRVLGKRLDPGWATLVAAALALVGTVVTVVFRGDSDNVGTPAAGLGAVATETTAGTTGAEPTTTSPSTSNPTNTSSAEATTTTTTATTTTAPLAPVVQVVSQLIPDERDLALAAADAILVLARRMPLIVDDDFADNDYAWPQGTQTFNGGIECSWTLVPGAYQGSVTAPTPSSWCSNGLDKVAFDFLLTADLALRDSVDSEMALLFRYEDFQNHYALRINPGLQLMRVAHVAPGGEETILPWTVVPELAQA
ncbi:MAG: hypothetical protein WAS51_11730, partial [Ilumatobacteraceae bacterium]